MSKLFVLKVGEGEYDSYSEPTWRILQGHQRYNLDHLIQEFSSGDYAKMTPKPKWTVKNYQKAQLHFLESLVEWLVKKKKMKVMEFQEWVH
jgi:hypothetical protein